MSNSVIGRKADVGAVVHRSAPSSEADETCNKADIVM